MKMFLSTALLALFSFTSLIPGVLSAPSSHTKPDPDAAKKPSSSVAPKPELNATFISSAPHWAVYSDRFTGVNPLPAVSSVQGYNVFILSFLLLSGPADNALQFIELDATTRQQTLQSYHNAGISVLVSAFGSTDAPTSEGADPVATANTMAAFVKQWGLDGIDVDYEDFNAINSGTGSAENWLISFTNQLRSQLPAGQFIITHAPIAPWFTDNTAIYPHGAYHAVAESVGSKVDWWHVQFYNQGTDYTTCTTLLTTSDSNFPHTSIFEINRVSGIPLNKLVLGKPASGADAGSGFVALSTLAGCVSQGKNSGWNGGVMLWQYPDATAQSISTIRSQSFPV